MDSQKNDENENDLRLLQAVIREESGAWEKFVYRFSDLIYSFCSSVFSDPDLELEYLNVLRHFRSDNFAALRAYNGRAAFSTFLTIKLRDLLSRRLFDLFKEDPDRAWQAFERFFKERLNALKKQSDDLYQEICLRLVDKNYQCILSFDGRGSFTGYIGG